MMLLSFVLQLEDDVVALEPARSTEQETSRPPERVRSFKHLELVFFFFFPSLLSSPLLSQHVFRTYKERIKLK
jgi:hypothetical protein